MKVSHCGAINLVNTLETDWRLRYLEVEAIFLNKKSQVPLISACVLDVHRQPLGLWSP